jgi:hypothetical protein
MVDEEIYRDFKCVASFHFVPESKDLPKKCNFDYVIFEAATLRQLLLLSTMVPPRTQIWWEVDEEDDEERANVEGNNFLNHDSLVHVLTTN